MDQPKSLSQQERSSGEDDSAKGQETGAHSTEVERLRILARLPLLLNSSLDARRVIAVALGHLQALLNAEAATLFSVEPGVKEISFWVLQGAEKRLQNVKIPYGKGIVGWVIQEKKSLHVKDVASDARFFAAVDQESGFKTREVMCVPLIAHGERMLGAIQVLNPKSGGHFEEQDLSFLEDFSQQLTLALENARLFGEMREQHARLETLDRRKSELASVISHEFRTPLNIIRTAAELITGGIQGETATDVAKALFNGVDRLSRIIGQIINLSLVQPESIKPENATFAASSLLRDIVEKFSEVAAARRLALQLVGAECPASIRADRALIAVVLTNLLSNAIRFTPDGGTISVGCRAMTGMVEFSVTDTGIGIPESEISLIFEKFYEIVPAAYHSSGDFGFRSCGLGLGLPTAASILSAHGSKMEVHSEPGKGSRFSFRLPEAS